MIRGCTAIDRHTESYLSERDALEPLGTGDLRGGMPGRSEKVLHVLIAHSLAKAGLNATFGDEALALLATSADGRDPWWLGSGANPGRRRLRYPTRFAC